MIDGKFAQDSIILKNALLTHANKVSDVIDKMERTSDSDRVYFGYLKDFLINSGCLCDDILQASINDAVLLAMIGTRAILEDTINVHYLEKKTSIAERTTLAEDWLRISNDSQAQKNELDGISVADRAKIAGKDVRQLYYHEYALFCNYTHSSAQRIILNSIEHRELGTKKAILATLQAYANILACVIRIIGQDKPDELTAIADMYFATYRETVATSSIPLDIKESTNV